MGVLPGSLLALIYAFTSLNVASVHAASPGPISLGNDIIKFIPPCAQECFISFLDANFPQSTCSTTPTLDCLCTNNSTSGFTAGEGAVQCILAEANLGFCQGTDGSTAVAVRAYNMCFGKQNALPNTHSTITATLIVQSRSSSSVLVIATPRSTTSRSTGSSVSSTTLRPGSTVSPSNTIQTGTPSTSSSSTSTVSSIASPDTAAAQPTTTTSLTTPQVVGISVAAVGAAALAIGGLCLFGCLRRRKMRKARDSDLLPFQPDPYISSPNGFKRHPEKAPHGFKVSMPNRFRRNEENGGYYNNSSGGRGGEDYGGFGDSTDSPYSSANQSNNTGRSAGRSPPNRPPLRPIRPLAELDTVNIFARSSVRPDQIGIAISPESTRHPSKLLPEKPEFPQPVRVRGSIPKPTLGKLQIPQNPEPQRPDSITTQFEEDIQTPFENASGRQSQIETAYYGTARQQQIPYQGQYVTAQVPRVNITAPDGAGAKGQGYAQGDPDEPRPLAIRKSRQFEGAGRVPSSNYGRESLPGSEAGPSSAPYSVDWRPNELARKDRNLPAPQQYQAYSKMDHWQPGGPPESAAPVAKVKEQTLEQPRTPLQRSPIQRSPIQRSPIAESPSVGVSPVSYPPIPPRLSRDWGAAPNGSPLPRSFQMPTVRSVQPSRQKPTGREFGDLLVRPGRQPDMKNLKRMHSSDALSVTSNSSSLLERRGAAKQGGPLTLEVAAGKNLKWAVTPEEPSTPWVTKTFTPTITPNGDWELRVQ